jgi:hypothetical protein
MSDNQFYGWFDDATQTTATYDPPHDAPCPFCGCKITANDVRTHNMAMGGQYAPRSYFYRTHRTCSDTDKTVGHTAMDEFIFTMIERNGD